MRSCLVAANLKAVYPYLEHLVRSCSRMLLLLQAGKRRGGIFIQEPVKLVAAVRWWRL